jgi:hypothetical protein
MQPLTCRAELAILLDGTLRKSTDALLTLPGDILAHLGTDVKVFSLSKALQHEQKI